MVSLPLSMTPRMMLYTWQMSRPVIVIFLDFEQFSLRLFSSAQLNDMSVAIQVYVLMQGCEQH